MHNPYCLKIIPYGALKWDLLYELTVYKKTILLYFVMHGLHTLNYNLPVSFLQTLAAVLSCANLF